MLQCLIHFSWETLKSIMQCAHIQHTPDTTLTHTHTHTHTQETQLCEGFSCIEMFTVNNSCAPPLINGSQQVLESKEGDAVPACGRTVVLTSMRRHKCTSDRQVCRSGQVTENAAEQSQAGRQAGRQADQQKSVPTV